MRIDRQGVVIDVDSRRAVIAERLPSVFGNGELAAEYVDALRVVGVDTDLTVVHGPRVRIAHLFPGVAAVD